MIRELTLSLIAAASATTSWAQDGETPAKQAGYEGTAAVGGPSGVSKELDMLDDYRDALFEPPWTEALLGPWFNLKRDLNDNARLRLGVNVLTLFQHGSEDGSGGEDSAAGGIYRFQGSWDALRSDHSTGKFEWRLESRSSIGGELAPQSLGGSYVGAINTGFPYGDDFETDLTVLNWSQTFTQSRFGYAVGRLAFDVYLDASAVQSPYKGFVNRAFVLSPALATTGLGALGAVAKGFVSDNVWIGAQIYDGNAQNGEFDLDTIEEGEYLKAVEIGWTPAFERRAVDRIQFTYWEKDERELAGVPEGSGWALTATRQFTPALLGFLRAADNDGGAGVAADSAASIGLDYQLYQQRSVALGIGWAAPRGSETGPKLDDEWVVESSYRMQITRNFSLTPDLQWVKNPTRIPDKSSVWIFGLRAVVTL